jgi:hypothetical protein
MSGRGLRLGAVAAAAAILALGGCEDVTVSPAEVASVEISPNPVTLAEGESATVVATTRESGGKTLEGRTIRWSSDDPEIASISEKGVVEGHVAGSTRIRAEAEGVEGWAEVSVAQGPRIALGRSSVEAAVPAGQAQPIRVDVSVRNGGGGELSDLRAEVELEDAPDIEWLTASLGGSTAPTTLRISLRARDLVPGEHRGRVRVRSAAAGNSPQTVHVRLDVTEPDEEDSQDEPEDDESDEESDESEPEDDEPENDESDDEEDEESNQGPPLVRVDPSSVELSAPAGRTDPVSAVVRVTDAGSGKGKGKGKGPGRRIDVDVRYRDGGSAGWLSTDLDNPRTPADLTLRASARDLSPGTYRAVVEVSSGGPEHGSVEVDVTFTVTASESALEATPSGHGRPSVAGPGPAR